MKKAGWPRTGLARGGPGSVVFQVDVFTRNVFDANYITALTIQTGNSGLILGQPGDPRLVGVTVRADF